MAFDDFGQPIGMQLDPNNRWVKQAKLIPRDEVEKLYAKQFPSSTGGVALPARMGLGALLIQLHYDVSDREVVQMIQENPYLQSFCGMKSYDSEQPPFDPSTLVHFRKRLGLDLTNAINELIIAPCQKCLPAQIEKPNQETEAPSDTGTPADCTEETAAADATQETAESEPNDGTLILNATCAPVNIRFPQDTSILDEARTKSDKLIDTLCGQLKCKRPRTYRRSAAETHQAFCLKRKHSYKEIRAHLRQELGWLKRNLKRIETLMEAGGTLDEKEKALLDVLKRVYDQQKYMYDEKVHRVDDRIVSIAQPWVRPIVRGKTKNPTEFGPKVHLSVNEGYVRVEQSSFDAFNEGIRLQECVERYREREGHYPKRVLADKIYRTRENLRYCKEHGIRLLGPSLGRKKKDQNPEEKKATDAQMHQDGIDRIEVERQISTGKRCCGLGLIWTKLAETTQCIVGLAAICLNLRNTLRALFVLPIFLRALKNGVFLPPDGTCPCLRGLDFGSKTGHPFSRHYIDLAQSVSITFAKFRQIALLRFVNTDSYRLEAFCGTSLR